MFRLLITLVIISVNFTYSQPFTKQFTGRAKVVEGKNEPDEAVVAVVEFNGTGAEDTDANGTYHAKETNHVLKTRDNQTAQDSIIVSPVFLDFGTVIFGSDISLTFTITNLDTTPKTIRYCLVNDEEIVFSVSPKQNMNYVLVSGETDTITVTFRPFVVDPPTGLMYARDPGSTMVSLGWSQPADTTSLHGYYIYRARGSAPDITVYECHLIDSTDNTTTSYLDDIISWDSTHYKYEVRAVYLDSLDVNVSGPTDSAVVGIAANSGTVPGNFTLHQNYPNPFNPATSIRYYLTTNSLVRLNIYNISGQLVRALVRQPQSPGGYAVDWDGRNDAGVNVASGIYIYRFEARSLNSTAAGFTQSKKMVLLR